MHSLVISLLGCLLSLVALAQRPLSATVSGKASGTVYFSHDTGQELKMDSAFIANHRFTFSDYQPFMLYSIWFKGEDKTEQKLILYPSARITFDANFDLAISDKDSVNYRYLQFKNKHLQFIDYISQLSYETDKPATQDSLYRERVSLPPLVSQF